jgi:hypothetical protein
VLLTGLSVLTDATSVLVACTVQGSGTVSKLRV